MRFSRIREGVTKWTRLGRTFLLPYGLAFLAQELVRHGDQAGALAALREGLAIGRGHGRAFLGCGTTPPYRDRAARRKQARRGRSFPSARNPTLRKPNKRNRWNCAPPPASRASGAGQSGFLQVTSMKAFSYERVYRTWGRRGGYQAARASRRATSSSSWSSRLGPWARLTS
jgi:hypothetical protein